MIRLFKKIFLVAVLIPPVILLSYLVYPNVWKLRGSNPEKTSFMKYRENEWKRKGIEKEISQTWVPINRISGNVIQAVVIAEDDKFWTHNGFDFEAMHDAAMKNYEKKKFKYGGSTITQQLAKNLYLNPAKNPIRKIKEAFITWRLEHTLEKKRILELYLNVVEWGDGIFGIEAAARHYYGKSAAMLGPDEAAHLAVILPNPRRLKIGSSRYVERRASIIYSRMMRRGGAAEDSSGGGTDNIDNGVMPEENDIDPDQDEENK